MPCGLSRSSVYDSTSSAVMTTVTPLPTQRADHAVQRLAEVLAERRRQRQLEPRQRVDHDPRGADAAHRLGELLQGLVDREIERPQVEQLELALVDQLRQLAPPGAVVQVLVGPLLEHGDHAGLAVRDALADELGGQDRSCPSPRARRSSPSSRRGCRRPSSRRARRRRSGGARAGSSGARRSAAPGWAGAGRPAARRRRSSPCAGRGSTLPAHLHDLQLAHDRVAVAPPATATGCRRRR